MDIDGMDGHLTITNNTNIGYKIPVNWINTGIILF